MRDFIGQGMPGLLPSNASELTTLRPARVRKPGEDWELQLYLMLGMTAHVLLTIISRYLALASENEWGRCLKV